MGQRGAVPALFVIAALVSACDAGGAITPSARVSPTSRPSGLTLACTDNYPSERTMGPLENGEYVHHLCRNGKVTGWWIDHNTGNETAPPVRHSR